jgi:hypothetical protein
VKSPYDVGDYKRMSPREKEAAFDRWAPVLRREFEVGKPRLLVPMGDDAREALARMCGAMQSGAPPTYPGRLMHYATFNYRNATLAQRERYEKQFADLHSYILNRVNARL